jgi:alcohol dehydrogenase class IV
VAGMPVLAPMISGVLRSPRLVLFGRGQRRAAGRLVGQLGRKAFVCTDGRVDQDPLLMSIIDDLRGAGVDARVFSGTVAELPLSCVTEAIGYARRFGPDVIVGLGGGSSLDMSKVVAVGLAYGEPLSEFYGEFNVPGPTLPVIAIPTTSGTGSEVTPIAVLGDPSRTLKVGISSPHLLPYASICDPELTVSCPAALTAISGADALTHALEAFTALRREPSAALGLDHVFVGKNVFSDALARQAIAALTGNLLSAWQEGDNIAAREQVMYGALMAGQAFGMAGVTGAHAIQYPVGAVTHTAHGLGVATLEPYVMEFNRPACGPEFAEVSRLFGMEGGEHELADAAPGLVADLFKAVGLPANLEQLGLAPDDIGTVSQRTLEVHRLLKNNPRVLDEPTLRIIIQAAYDGDRQRLRGFGYL